MIRLRNILLAFVALTAFAACGGSKDEMPVDITGEWNLVNVQTKSATLGGQTVDVYVSFLRDKSFTMYQMLGQGRYHKYSGTWALSGTTLTGKYSDGKQWGSSYEVERLSSGNEITLTSPSGEVDTYRKASIPSSVTDNAI